MTNTRLHIPACSHWRLARKGDRRAVELADGHYSRRKVGSPQFMPPGQTIVLLTRNLDALWGWWRPHPASGIVAMNGFDGWTCSIFRNVGRPEAGGGSVERACPRRGAGVALLRARLRAVRDAHVRVVRPGAVGEPGVLLPGRRVAEGWVESGREEASVA